MLIGGDKKSSILVVEDSSIYQKALYKMLSKHGYDVKIAKTLKEANNLTKERDFDFIILDLMLPDGEGEDILLALNNNKKSKIIVYTSDKDISRREEWFRYGVLGYLSKNDPFKYVITQMINIIETHKINHKFNILVIDDSRFVRRQISSLLAVYNYNIIIAENGKDAMEVIEKNELDLVVLDLVLPDMDGVEVLKHIRKKYNYSELPVFILTGEYPKSIMARLVKEGANEFFVKPFTPELFLIKVNFWLEFRRKNLENIKNEFLLNELQYVIDKSVIMSKTDINGTITLVNDNFCKDTGYTREELIGKNHRIIRDPSTPKELYEDMWNTILDKRVWQGVLKNRRKDGSSNFSKCTIVPILNYKNDIEAFISIREDITKVKLAEEKAKSLNKSKSEFLANMSHEIRTPLNAIVGFMDLLKGTCKDNKEVLEYIKVMQSSSDSLLQIIEDILDFSKIESGKLNIDKIYFNPKEELRSVAHLFDARCSEKNITLIINVDNNMPDSIYSDPLRIKQIIANLLSNAIKFTEGGKKIEVDISYEDGYLKCSVKDEGKGIAKDKIEHIFEAFNQEDNSTTREYGGTGLGLTISSRLAKLLGGELKVESKLGKGSNFYFKIPAKPGERVEEKDQSSKDASFEGKKALLVEDNRANQMLMNIILKKLKVEFDIANNGKEAVELYKQNSYDFILMDENMPIMSGIEATKEILEYEKTNNLKHTPIIALTANAIKGDKERFLEAGMDEYLSKPVKLQDFKNLIRELL